MGESLRASRDGQIPKDEVGFDLAACSGEAAASVARGSKCKNRRRPLRAAAAAADAGARHLQEESRSESQRQLKLKLVNLDSSIIRPHGPVNLAVLQRLGPL